MKIKNETMNEKINKSELYRISKALHKDYQFRQFRNSLNSELLEGEQVRREDAKGRSPCDKGYDPSTSRFVLYAFKNGYLHSENGLPAVQYINHWEIWENGMIVQVFDDGGNIHEQWDDGVPVMIENNALSDKEGKGSSR